VTPTVVRYPAAASLLHAAAGYEVSDRLRVRSLARTVPRGRFQRRVRERFLAAAVQHKTGYLQVTLSCEGRQRQHYVHVLMREAFGEG
jgi:hypothetical protein